ncbi:MAG: EVE domain-containing protein [Porticoccaceae bacterium]|nr:EVE domain-containing protein [Porticoccaceae bacterium]
MPGHWLFKSEPGEYSIADLAREPRKTGRWDGIRNYQARNFLRDEVKLNDLAFFYHSSCKQPGIVGIAKIVSAPYPDPGQFLPDGPYFDSKATPAAPRWYSVDLQHVETFATVITPGDMRNLDGLENMYLFKQGRLSIQPVNDQEWQQIMALAKSRAPR